MYLRKDQVKLPPHVLEQKLVLSDYYFNQLDKTKIYLLSFSGGKDSVLTLYLALKAGLKCEVVHYYLAENLSYNEVVLQWFEKEFGITIHRLESGMTIKMMDSDLLLINNVWKIKSYKANPFKKNERIAQAFFKYDYNILGIKSTDSTVRKMLINKNGWHVDKTKHIYPIHHWNDKEVWHFIYENNLPVNRCYEWFGRSQDVINMEHLYPLKENSPKDFISFIYKYPLIEALVWIYEKRTGKNVIQSFQFSENAKKGNLYHYGNDLNKYLIFCFGIPAEKEIWAATYTEDAYIVYLDGNFWKANKMIPEKLTNPDTDLIPLAGHVQKDEDYKQAGERFRISKDARNNLDYFVILVFDTHEEKKQWCRHNELNENINALDGAFYELV